MHVASTHRFKSEMLLTGIAQVESNLGRGGMRTRRGHRHHHPAHTHPIHKHHHPKHVHTHRHPTFLAPAQPPALLLKFDGSTTSQQVSKRSRWRPKKVTTKLIETQASESAREPVTECALQGPIPQQPWNKIKIGSETALHSNIERTLPIAKLASTPKTRRNAPRVTKKAIKKILRR